MNILILSCGTRNKIIQYFRESFANIGSVVVTDCDILAPALYDADKYYIVPKIDDENYLERIIDICKLENINAVLSLIDPELSLLANNKTRFDNLGITIIGSEYETCERTFNKWEMDQWLETNGYYHAKSYIDLEEFLHDEKLGKVSFPVFVKPIHGSASINNTIANNIEIIQYLFSMYDDLMIQEFLYGQEIGADCYIDMISKEVVSIFTKKKLKMRAGETDKAISFKDDKLFQCINDFIDKSGFTGVIDIDIFDVGGKYYFSEVNPRFGGGYPLAYECNENFMLYILNNMKGIVNDKKIGIYPDNVNMMKYNEIKIIKQ